MQSNIKYISHANTNGEFMLSLFAKKTFVFNEGNNLVEASEDNPVHTDPIFENEDKILLQDIDIYPQKPFTDIVIEGSVNCGSELQRDLFFTIGDFQNRLTLLGKRKAYKSADGRIKFTERSKIEEIELGYHLAYGGKDEFALSAFEDYLTEMASNINADVDINDLYPFSYPRNPEGKGYIIDWKGRIEFELELPQIEDPFHRLAPDNLLVQDTKRWHEMPVPRGFSWVNTSWFPRILFSGFFDWKNEDFNKLEECKRNWLDPSFLMADNSQKIFNFGNGASMGMSVQHLKGNEKISLENFFAMNSKVEFKLPNLNVELKIDNRKGGLKKVSPIIQSIIINLERKEVDIVWCGTGKAIRPYFEEELSKMPYSFKY